MPTLPARDRLGRWRATGRTGADASEDASLVVRERDGPPDSAWVSDEVRATLDLDVGDAIRVEGRRETVAELRAGAAGASSDEVHLSADVVENAGVGVDDFVAISRVGRRVPPAEKVVVHPVSPSSCEAVEAGEARVKEALEGRLVAFGEHVSTGLPSPSVVEVARKRPAVGPVEVGEDTVVGVRDRPGTAAMKLLLEGSRMAFERSVDRRQRIVSNLNQAIQINFLVASIIVTGALAMTDVALADYRANGFLLLGSGVWLVTTGATFALTRGIGGERVIGPDTSDLWSLLYRGATESNAAYFLLESYDHWADRNVEANAALIRQVWYARSGTFVAIVLLVVGLLLELR